MIQQPIAQPTTWQRIWRFPLTRIFTYLCVFIALALVLQFPILGVLKLFHLHTRHHREAGELVTELLLAACAVGAYVFMIGVVEKRSLASAGFAVHGVGAETSLGLLIGSGLFSLVIGITAALGSYHVASINLHFAWLVPLILFLFTAIFEETVFRGYFFQTLESRWGSGIALAGSGVAFGLIHLVNPVSGVTLAEKFAGPLFIIFEASILMTAGYLLTRRLWLPIGIHWGWNFFENSVFGATELGRSGEPCLHVCPCAFFRPVRAHRGRVRPGSRRRLRRCRHSGRVAAAAPCHSARTLEAAPHFI